MEGILIVGHGSRSEEAKELFPKIIEALRSSMIQ